MAQDIVDETCHLDGQVQRMMLDGASDIEVVMVDDNGNPPARETGQNRGMLYMLKIGLQTRDGCWHNVSPLTVFSHLCVGKRSWPSIALSMTKR